MKVCLQCDQENDDNALSCLRCRQGRFSPAVTTSAQANSNPTRPPQGPEFLTSEREGRLTVLKCRTPREAFLVAEELEAADILIVFPDDELLLKEYETNGFVSIRVSAQSYEAAKELQTVIEQKHWDERGKQALPIAMIFLAVGLGFIPLPGFFVYRILIDTYKAKKFERKARLFRRWFFLGLTTTLLLIVFAIISSRLL